MFLNYYIFKIMSIISLFMLSYFYYISLTLLGMEFTMLSVSLILIPFKINSNINVIMYYLVFVVCESVLGSTSLILLFRNYGNHNMSMSNLILW